MSDGHESLTFEHQSTFGPGAGWRVVDLIVAVIFAAITIQFSRFSETIWGLGIGAAFFGLRGVIGLGWVSGFTLDHATQQVRAWRGWLVPLCGSWRSLAPFDEVVLSFAVRSEGRTIISFYTISLRGARQQLNLTEIGDLAESRRLATDVAAFLGFDLVDEAELIVTRTSAENVGRSIVDQQPEPALSPMPRTQRIQQEPANPFDFRDEPVDAVELVDSEFRDKPVSIELEQPVDSRIGVEEFGNITVVRIPRRTWGNVLYVPMMMAMIMSGIIGLIAFGIGGLVAKYPFDLNRHLIPGVGFTVAFGIAGFLVGLLMELGTAFVSYELEADPHRVIIRRSGLIFGSTSEYPVEEITGLQPTGLGGLRVITHSKEELLWHEGISHQEAEWLRSLLLARLAPRR